MILTHFMTWIRRYKKQTNKQANKQKSLFIKFQLISILHLQVMNNYVHWNCSIDYCARSIYLQQLWLWKLFLFSPWKRFLLFSFEEMCFLEERYQKLQKNQIFTLLEPPLWQIWEYAQNNTFISNIRSKMFFIFLCILISSL